jgi:hypothetical protein
LLEAVWSFVYLTAPGLIGSDDDMIHWLNLNPRRYSGFWGDWRGIFGNAGGRALLRWVSRDTVVPSYVFFGFDADTAMASYLFTVIDRAMATALRHFERRN